MGFQESLQLYQSHLEQQVAQRSKSTTKWMELSADDLDKNINVFFNRAVTVLKQLSSDKSFEPIIEVFKQGGDLHNFCTKHQTDQPLKVLLMDLEQFINALPNATEAKQTQAFKYFPPEPNHEKYGFCVAGMNNSLTDALDSLDQTSAHTQLLKQAVDSCIYSNKIFNTVYEGNHIHVPFFVLSLFLPRELIEKLDHAYKSPQSDISCAAIHNILNQLPVEVANQSSTPVYKKAHEDCHKVGQYLASTLNTISKLKGESITLLAIGNLPLIKELNLDPSEFLSDYINDDYQSINIETAAEALHAKSLQHIKRIIDEVKIAPPSDTPTFQDIFNSNIPEKDENLINKLYVFSHDGPGYSPILFIQLIQKINNVSIIEDGLQNLISRTEQLLTKRPDLQQRLEQIKSRLEHLNSEHSGFGHLVNKKEFTLQELLKGNGSFEDISQALDAHTQSYPNQPIHSKCKLDKIFHNPSKDLIIEKIVPLLTHDQKNETLLTAISLGDNNTVSSLLEAGASVLTTKVGNNALQLAIKSGHSKTLKIILEKTPEPIKEQLLKSISIPGENILQLGIISKNTEIVEILINNASDDIKSDWLFAPHSDGTPTFQFALKTRIKKMVNAVLNSASNDEVKKNLITANISETSSLEVATTYGDLSVVELLFSFLSDDEKQEQIQISGTGNNNVFHLASAGGKTDIMKYLLKFVSDAEKEKLLMTCNKDNKSPLHYALEYTRNESIHFITENLTVENRNKLLNLKDKKGINAFLTAIDCCELSIIELLFSALSDVEKADLISSVSKKGNNAFHIASLHGKTDIMQYLLDFVGDAQKEKLLMTCNESDESPLNFALGTVQNESVDFIVRNLNSKNLTELLIKNYGIGFNTFLTVVANHELSTMMLLFLKLADHEIIKCISSINIDNTNVFHVAAYHNKIDIMRHLLNIFTEKEKRRLINDLDDAHTSPLDYAIQEHHQDAIKLLMNEVEPQSKQDSLLKLDDDLNVTLLKLLNDQPQLSTIILENLTPEEKSEIFSYPVKNAKTIIDEAIAIKDYDAAQKMIKMLDGNTLYRIIQSTGKNNDSLLEAAVKNDKGEMLKTILEKFSLKQKYELLLPNSSNKQSILSLAFKYDREDAAEILIENFTSEQILHILLPTETHYTSIQSASNLNKFKLLQNTLSKLKPMHRLELLLAPDPIGESFLHTAFLYGNDDLIKTLVEGLDNSQVIILLKNLNSNELSVIDRAVENNQYDTLSNFLSRFSSEELVDFIISSDSSKPCIFAKAISDKDHRLLDSLTKHISSNDIVKLIEISSADGWPALQALNYHSNYQLMNVLLKRLSSEVLSNLILESNFEGLSLFDTVMRDRNTDVLNVLLEHLDQTDRMAMIQKPNKDNLPAIHLASVLGHDQTVDVLLKHLTPDEKKQTLAQTVKDQNSTEWTPLMLAQAYGHSRVSTLIRTSI